MTGDRTDAELRQFNPTRVAPFPDTFDASKQATWQDYDFRSLDEFIRWSNIRAAERALRGYQS